MTAVDGRPLVGGQREPIETVMVDAFRHFAGKLEAHWIKRAPQGPGCWSDWDPVAVLSV